MKTPKVKRSRLVLRPDNTRVLLRPFLRTSDMRADRICALIMEMTESSVHDLWTQVHAEFGDRHSGIDTFLLKRYELAKSNLPGMRGVSEERKLLIGSYFSHEYSLEAAALFNPSLVPHPDQTGAAPGALRVVMSLRATGEGHVSSITFRTGMIDVRNRITIDTASPYCIEPEQEPNPSMEKELFHRKLQELGQAGVFCRRVLHDLPDVFTMKDLRHSVREASRKLRARGQITTDAAHNMIMLAQSNYEVHFPPDSLLSERVLFPTTPSQSNGIEDARFVRFDHEDGASTYYATYTAYDGRMILPQFIETADFCHFKFTTLNGPAVKNKGMALFPRKINGRYAMLGRLDFENIYIMFSDNLHFWNTAELLVIPAFPWEFVQLGNCGSPIETKAGWLVISHGVGAMRKYSIGAFLLDLDDPSKVIGRLGEPLITPNENEREGYVPNVVYSCGSILHDNQVIIPYAMSDSATTFASIPLDKLLAAMQ